MRLSLFGREFIRVERNRNGQFTYQLFDGTDFVNSKDYLNLSLTNPVLNTIIALRSSLYSKMEIKHLNANGEVIESSPYIKLLNNPNYFQSREDFFFQQMWFLSAVGTDYIYQKQLFTNDIPVGLYNLIPSEIDFKQAHKLNKFIWTKKEQKEFGDRTIEYTLDNTTFKIKLSELIPLYDLANGLTNNSFISSPSRVKAIIKPLENIEQNLHAKHKNLQFSAKYLGLNDKQVGSGQMSDEDKNSITKVLGSKDVILTNRGVDFKHLVSDLKRLYFDEQYADDFNKCLLAFEMNKNVINPFSKDSTFENQEQGLISYVQNSTQQTASATMNSLNQQWGLYDKGEKLVASYDHLAIMQPVLNKKVDSFKVIQEVIKLGLENQTITSAEAKAMSDEFKVKLGL